MGTADKLPRGLKIPNLHLELFSWITPKARLKGSCVHFIAGCCLWSLLSFGRGLLDHLTESGLIWKLHTIIGPAKNNWLIPDILWKRATSIFVGYLKLGVIQQHYLGLDKKVYMSPKTIDWCRTVLALVYCRLSLCTISCFNDTLTKSVIVSFLQFRREI